MVTALPILSAMGLEAELHRVILEHLETFLEEACSVDGGLGVPEFVERAFRKNIECGCLANGFLRVRCSSCGFERLLPFSCKVRGLCPSCSGRRMAELSAHLIDSVIPIVGVRQWVLTFPYPLRYSLAWNHESARAVLAIFNRTLEGFYRDKARQMGLSDGRTGSVTVIQRVGSALNLNPHFHTLFLDGVFVRVSDGAVSFHPVGPITDEDVAQVLALVRTRVLDLLEGEGLFDEDDSSFQFDELSEPSPSLAGIYSAGVQGRVALGQRSGRPVMRVGSEPNAPWVTSRAPLQAHLEGFDLHGAVAVGAQDRERLERLCRYILRPPVSDDRLELLDDGRILLELKTPFWDGTTHLVYEPLELLEKVAAVIPRPQVNQLIYAGVLGPNASLRKAVVAFGREGAPAERECERGCVTGEAEGEGTDDGQRDNETSGEDTNQCPVVRRRRSYSWAELLARIFLIDVLECPMCQGRMKIISTIKDPEVIHRILEHLGLPTEVPSPAPARSPQLELEDIIYDFDDF